MNLRFERQIAAAPERVFDAFTEPAGQREFYGKDDDGWVVDSHCDLRVGGVWSIAFGPSPAELYHHRHVFEAIDRPRRIRMTTTETRLDGSSFDTTLEFVFEARNGGTLMTMVQSGFPSEELRDEHTRGLPHAFDRFAGRLSRSRSVLYMSMSLDGFITGPDDDASRGLGRDGERLHAWLGPGSGPDGFRPAGASAAIFDEVLATGAVLVGRRTFDHAGHWNGDHHDGVPIFVPTRGEAPPTAHERVHYVTDGVASAMRQAKLAAGDANVMVHGADLAQSLLRAHVLDELEIHLIPLLLGAGRPLFATEEAELELTRVVDAPGVTHLHYEVKA
jgi:dihydrofolate reductase/uncharacterized protein YndB with AHSA1/START domain